MKNCAKLISLLFLLFSGLFSQAQNIQTTPSTGMQCNGTAYLLDSMAYQSWAWLDANQQTLQSGGTYVAGLCPGLNYLQYVDSIGTGTFTFYIDTTGMCGGFGATVSASPVSAFGQCDATATATIYGGTMPYTYVWANGTTTTSTGGLCAGDNYFYASDANGCYYSVIFYVQQGDTTNTDTTSCPGFGIDFISVSQLSGPNTCDASIEVSAYGGDGNYSYSWAGGGMFFTGSSMYNLCSGTYAVTATDGNGCSATSYVVIYADSALNYNLTSYVYPYAPSADGLCDGSAYVDVYGGTAPYTFLHANGSTDQYATGLCSGIYSVVVTDANGDSLLVNYLVPEPSNIFNGGVYNDTIVADSLYNDLIEDCFLDYNSLDTAFISNIEYMEGDSLVVTWSVIDGNGTIEFQQSYTISTGVGVYELILQVFCPQRSGSPYVYAIDQVYFNPGALQLTENEAKEHFKVYPNPVQDLLHISLDEAGPSVITIQDLSGKVVYTEFATGKEIQLNVSHLAKGQYILDVLSTKTKHSTLILK